jgi:hypothetical protein
MVEVAENLHRVELTALERSEHVAEWVRLAEKKASEIKPAQVAPVSKGGRGKESGINAAARELGVERTDAQRSVKVDSLSNEAKDYARNHGLADNKSALFAAAKHKNDPASQVQSLSQRAIVAAKIADMKVGDNQHKQEAASNEATSQSAAAEKLNVSRSAVQRAMAAARIANIKHGENQYTLEDGPIGPSTIKEASEKLNVGRSSVKRARMGFNDGDLVRAEGAIKVETYEKDGATRLSLTMLANSVEAPAKSNGERQTHRRPLADQLANCCSASPKSRRR